MAFSLSINEPLNFVFTQCGYVLDDHAFRIHLLNFQAQINKMRTVRELIDTRTIRKADGATVQGLIELADLDRSGTADREEYLAVVVDNPLIREIANLYTNAVADKKKAIGFFHDILPALYWLGYKKSEVGRLRRFIHHNRM